MSENKEINKSENKIEDAEEKVLSDVENTEKEVDIKKNLLQKSYWHKKKTATYGYLQSSKIIKKELLKSA